MADDWHKTEIGEVFEVNPLRSIPRGQITPFVPMEVLPENGRSPTQIKVREFNGSGIKFKNGDTLIARITPCLENGKTVFIKELPEKVIGHGSTEYIVLSSKHNQTDNLFGYYLARSPEFRRYAIGHMEGTSGRQRVSSDAIKKYAFALPPLEEQKAISRILGTLDDKIELNYRMIETLESMARALFKDWFIDFGPVRTKMQNNKSYLPEDLWSLFPNYLNDADKPANWEIQHISKFLNLVYGKSLPARNRNTGDVPVYGSGGIAGFHDEALVTEKTIIVGRKGTVGSLYWENRPSFPIDTVFYIEPKASLSFCYYLLSSFPLRTMNTDAAVPGLNRDNVYRLEFPSPPPELVIHFTKITDKIREKIDTCTRESEILSQLRDTLLPKLISGEIRVKAAERIIGDAS